MNAWSFLLVGLFEKGMGCVLTVGGVSLWLGAEASKAHDILIWLSLIALWLLFQDVISHFSTIPAHRLPCPPTPPTMIMESPSENLRPSDVFFFLL